MNNSLIVCFPAWFKAFDSVVRLQTLCRIKKKLYLCIFDTMNVNY